MSFYVSGMSGLEGTKTRQIGMAGLEPAPIWIKPVALPAELHSYGFAGYFYPAEWGAQKTGYVSFCCSLHIIIFKTKNVKKTKKVYATFIKLTYSILIPSAVLFLPIFVATCSHVRFSKNLYRIIRCIRSGIVFSHASTSFFF